MTKPTDFPAYVKCYRGITGRESKLIVGNTYKVHKVQGDLVHVITGLNEVSAVHFSRFLPTNTTPEPTSS